MVLIIRNSLFGILLLCANVGFSQTKFFLSIESSLFSPSLSFGASSIQFALYFETKVGLNTSIGSGVKYLRYDHGYYFETFGFGSLYGIATSQQRNAYIGVPLEFSYFIDPRVGVKLFTNLLFLNRSLSSSSFDSENLKLYGSDPNESTFKSFNIDTGIAADFYLTRRLKADIGITYTTLLDNKDIISAFYPKDDSLPVSNANSEKEYIPYQHINLVLSFHVLLIRAKTKKI